MHYVNLLMELYLRSNWVGGNFCNKVPDLYKEVTERSEVSLNVTRALYEEVTLKSVTSVISNRFSAKIHKIPSFFHIFFRKREYFFDIFEVFVDAFCIRAPVNDGTQHLITSIRYMPHIGRDNGEKIDVDWGKKRIKWNCWILWSAVSPEWLDEYFWLFTWSYTTMPGMDRWCYFITGVVIKGN